MMLALIVVALVSLWILLGLIGAGFAEAYGRHQWPYAYITRKDVIRNRKMALNFTMFGPIGLIVILCSCDFGRNGWDLSSKPLSISRARELDDWRMGYERMDP